jgi:hypothetical protein
MTLGNLLPTLSKNTSLNITLLDDGDNEMITFNAAGWQNIEEDLTQYNVTKITVDSNKLIKVKIVSA